MKAKLPITTTSETKTKAERLCRFIFGRITIACRTHIERGEQASLDYIKRIEKEYNVIS